MNTKEEVDIFISKKFKYDIELVKKMQLSKKMSLIESDSLLYSKMKLFIRKEGYII